MPKSAIRASGISPFLPPGALPTAQGRYFPQDGVYHPACRTRQTAEVLFPGARLVEVNDLKEMCFGSFEGRNYIEMEHDPDYLAWVAANCESPCPDGETKAAFCERICAAFSALVDKALADGEEMLVILAHGGTQMAAMERYALPHKDYYEVVRPQRRRLCAGCQGLGGQTGAAPGKDRAVHKGGRRMIGYAVLGGFVLDAVFGDPAWLPHPVVYMGKAISALEKRLRARLPKTPQGELLGGASWPSACRWAPLLLTGLVCLGPPGSPAAGAGRTDVLVRAGTGRKGACAGEHQRLPGAAKSPTCLPPARR